MDDEITRLRELRNQLLAKALRLRDELKDQEDNGHRSTINLAPFSNDEEEEEYEGPSQLLFAKHQTKLCGVSGQVTGITFADVDKKWLRDDVYSYTAKAVTKMISFDLELIVLHKNSSDFKIEDIICRFEDDYCGLEVSSWSRNIIASRNFSHLMSAISDYNEYSVLRSKILHNLQINKYAKIEQCTEDKGGILLYMCSPADVEKCYIIFQWRIKFLKLTWHIEHFFTAQSTDIGIGFCKEKRSVIQKFCEVGLTRENLLEIWDNMCVAIDDYHAKNMEDI